MELKNIKNVKLEEVISFLEQEFDGYDLTIKFWEDEECRDHGISSIYTPQSSDLYGIFNEAKKLVDRDGKASVEVITSDNEDVLYFYDAVSEEVLSY